MNLFTAFPGRSFGIGLLALRASAALWIFDTALLGSLGLQAAGGVLSLLFACGFGVRLGAFIAATVALYVAIGSGSAWSIHAASHILELIALGLLGPGAYSLDAILFGRRTITLPHRNYPKE